MSWHFSQALEAEYLEARSLEDELYAQSNGVPFAPDDSCSGKMKDTFHRSPFGTMYVHSTDVHGVGLLTWFRADSLAKTLVQPARVLALKASGAECGRKWQGSFAKYSPVESKWKTAQCSLLGDSEEFLETWPRWGSMRNGVSYLRRIPELPTFERESGFWPTPNASDSNKWSNQSLKERKSKGQQVRLNTAISPEGGKGGLMNPAWVEWLMGWPEGWTGLEPLATAKFQEWLQQHGEF